MSFQALDQQRFPGLQLAWDVLAAPPGTPAILNAANEVAVAAFLDRKIRFDQIHAVNQATLASISAPPINAIGDLIQLDLNARVFAENMAHSMRV